jgi:hypothetical protein
MRSQVRARTRRAHARRQGEGADGRFATALRSQSSLSIVFDEGYDTPPDNFGLAILDNIDVNGVLVGKGPTDSD